MFKEGDVILVPVHTTGSMTYEMAMLIHAYDGSTQRKQCIGEVFSKNGEYKTRVNNTHRIHASRKDAINYLRAVAALDD